MCPTLGAKLLVAVALRLHSLILPVCYTQLHMQVQLWMTCTLRNMHTSAHRACLEAVQIDLQVPECWQAGSLYPCPSVLLWIDAVAEAHLGLSAAESYAVWHHTPVACNVR